MSNIRLGLKVVCFLTDAAESMTIRADEACVVFIPLRKPRLLLLPDLNHSSSSFLSLSGLLPQLSGHQAQAAALGSSSNNSKQGLR
jgi:hypothetical protein